MLMPSKQGFKIAIVAAAIASSYPVFAQDNSSGTVRGQVQASAADRSGVVIHLKHTNQGFSRTATSNASGEFQLKGLPVGRYSVTLEYKGQRKMLADVDVKLGQAVVLSPQLSDDIERIAVSGSVIRPVDTSNSTAGLTIDTALLDKMPVNNGFENTALLAPGVTRNSSFGASSFGGASSAENGYFLNGMNISALRTGIGSINLPWEAIAQTQVKTGAVSAEYDRFIGGVINAVSRSGGNDFHYGAEYRYDPAALASPHDSLFKGNGDYALNYDAHRNSFREGNVWFSGALVEDSLFFYALLNPRDTKQQWANSAASQQTNRNVDENRWFINMDWYINANHSVTVTALDNSGQTTDQMWKWQKNTGKGASIGATEREFGGNMTSLRYQGTFTDALTLSATIGRVEDQSNSVPSNQLPGVWDYVNKNGERIGSWTDSNLVSETYQRDQLRIDVEYQLDDHRLQFGLDQETLAVDYLEFQNGSGEARGWWEYRNLSAISNINLPAGTYVTRRQRDTGGRSEVRSRALYLQDSWQVNDHWVVNAGLRNSSFANTASTGQTYAKLDNQWAPRVQLIWDPAADGSRKVFVTLGRYFQPIAANMNIKQASGQSDVTVYYKPSQLGSDGAPVLGADGAPAHGDKVATRVVQSGEVDVERIVSRDLGSMYSDELTLGLEQELTDTIKGGVRFVYRDLKQSIEDSDIGPVVAQWLKQHKIVNNSKETYFYTLLNPGQDVTFSYDFDRDGKREVVNLTAAELGLPAPKRRYTALEFNLEGQATEQLHFLSSYVWSHSWGLTEGLVRSDNEQADPGWTTSYDYADLMDHGYGNLPNDRRHAFKLSGVYQFNQQWDLGLVSRITSGAPKNKFSIHPSDVDTCKAPSLWANWCASQWYNEASFYDWDGTPAPRGSAGRQSWLTELDVALTYRADLWGGEFSSKLTVYNLLNRKTVLNSNEIAQITNADGSYARHPDYNLATRLQDYRLTSLVLRYQF